MSETFTRYQNQMYRVLSVGGAALVAILGVTGFVIGRTLDPVPPPAFFYVDLVVTAAMFVWYILGVRCRLDVGEGWVHVATKYGDLHLERDQVIAVEADMSLWGALQWSGRPVIVHYRVDDRTKTYRAFGCLPNGAVDQAGVVAELQAVLGRPETAESDDLAASVERRLSDGSVDPIDGDAAERAALATAVADRLATMTPEGDPSDLGDPGAGTDEADR